MEISALGVNKGAMLGRVCQRMGIDAADVAAFGDMPNDLSCSAGSAKPYVVANAHPALLEQGFPTVPPTPSPASGRRSGRLLG